MITGLELARLTAGDFARRAAMADPQGPETGDFAFNPDIEDLLKSRATREAAVLIGVSDSDDGAKVLLTMRTANLRSHAGQVAFPGGRIDHDDSSAADAAVRECMEETGIASRHVEVVGQLAPYVSGSGYRIHPVLAVISGNPAMQANPDEVDAIFHVPLAHLVDPSNHRRESRVWNGVERHFFTIPYEPWHIWGVTAGIIRAMSERLYP